MIDGEFSPNVGKPPNHNTKAGGLRQMRTFWGEKARQIWRRCRKRRRQPKTSHYLLAVANFGEEAESSVTQVDVEGLLMDVEFLDGCHDDRFKLQPES
jgi:hypothetical protein